jgi:hypothetical protein
MSLSASQQRALDQIENTLANDHPGLGPLFATFTSLFGHEAMPLTERVTARQWRPRSRHRPRSRVRRRLRPAVAALVGLGVAVVALFALSLTLRSPQGCPGSGSAIATRMQSVPAGRLAACTTQEYRRAP